MGTGNVAGVYFPVGVALCRLVNQHRRETGLRCAARPSEGSVGNLTALRDGSYDLAIVQSDTQAAALAGSGVFAPAGPFEALRSVASLYPEPLTVVARADAGIAGIGDLAGKRVAWGAPGSGTRAVADELMAARGLDGGELRRRPRAGARPAGGRALRGRDRRLRLCGGASGAGGAGGDHRLRRGAARRGGAGGGRAGRGDAGLRGGDDPGRALPRHPAGGRDLRRRGDARHPRRRAGGADRHHRAVGLRRPRDAARARPGRWSTSTPRPWRATGWRRRCIPRRSATTASGAG